MQDDTVDAKAIWGTQNRSIIAIDHGVVKSSPLYRRRTATDFIVYGLILTFGALQFGLARRSNDFFTGDVTYFELARSMIEKGFYGFDFKPETLLPPGFPLILASLCKTLGSSYVVLIRSMAVFATLGFLAAYELFCCMGEQLTGAISCLLLFSSEKVFVFATHAVMSDLPYFLTSMLVLLLAMQIDITKNRRARAILSVLCGLSIGASLLIRSSGIALIAGLFAWLAVSRLSSRHVWVRRLKTFVPLLLIGLFTEIIWMEWGAKHEVLQWPTVGGYPQSYIAQLTMKNGNNPELGKASWSDIPLRVEKNLNDRAVVLTELVLRRDYINSDWVSPFVLVPLFLTMLGLSCSILRNGGSLTEWYFVFHEGMYLLWPWNFEMRFFLPVAPLACLYLFRGAKVFRDRIPKLRPRVVGGLTLLMSVAASLDAVPYAWYSGALQPAVAAVFWASLTAVSAWIAYTGSYKSPNALAPLMACWKNCVSIGGKRLGVAKVSGVLILVALLVVGMAQEISKGLQNLRFDVTNSANSDILAGKWIRSHTANVAVVMARQLDVVYHYSGRKVIWFPPSRDPKLLMEGIQKYNVKFIVIDERQYSYWYPTEEDCFQSLTRAYPGSFQLVHEEPRLKIFEVAPDYT
jgi:hypothetical protein